MPMAKKANGSNFKVSGGELTVRFDVDGPAVVHVVCVWGPKPEFGGQRPKLWCSETVKSSRDGATVTVPATSRPGFAEPLERLRLPTGGRPAAVFSRNEAGAVFSSRLNDLSW